MNTAIVNARALLMLFARSEWKDLYVRYAEGEVFIARTSGGANPMLSGNAPATITAGGDAGAVAAQAFTAAESILAPHVGTVVSILAPRTAVNAGVVVAQIEVLGQRIDICSALEGIVADVWVVEGQFIEYGFPLISIAPAG